jgi:hypothetical protein
MVSQLVEVLNCSDVLLILAFALCFPRLFARFSLALRKIWDAQVKDFGPEKKTGV